MIDIFELLGIQYREDKYTACLIKMIEYGDVSFRNKVGFQFGFDNKDYCCKRRSFNHIESSTRKKITPDFILYNSDRVAIIESKMYANEGFQQTLDYGKNIDEIRTQLEVPNAKVALYFMTLSGAQSENKEFACIKWGEFYEAILINTKFDDMCLEVIRLTILEQARKYRNFEIDLFDRPYHELFNPSQYWISPFSLLSSGQYDDAWQEVAGKEKFRVYNFEVTGNGHSEFITDLYKDKWRKQGIGQYDNIHLFIRIEWAEANPIVWLGWEFYDRESEKYAYVQKKTNVPQILHQSFVKSLIDYKNIWRDSSKLSHFKTTKRTQDSIKALKCEIQGDKKAISEIINAIKEVIAFYSDEIECIIASFSIDGDCLGFNKETYKQLSQQIEIRYSDVVY